MHSWSEQIIIELSKYNMHFRFLFLVLFKSEKFRKIHLSCQHKEKDIYHPQQKHNLRIKVLFEWFNVKKKITVMHL